MASSAVRALEGETIKVADIISKVETIREGGESIPKLQVKSGESLKQTLSAYKTSIDRKWAEENKPKTPEVKSPTLEALGRLQDSGLGQRLPEIQEATLVGKKA